MKMLCVRAYVRFVGSAMRRTTALSGITRRQRLGWVEAERTCWDPKDGELCLSRMKPEETLVEVRSGSDVQIDRLTWV
jgi:hypothetical protein